MPKKLKKIVMYIDTLAHGGAQRVMVNLAEYFNAIGVEVILINDFALESSQAQYQVSPEIKRYYLRKSVSGNLILKNLERIIRLRKVIKNEKSDCVLSFLGRPNKRMLIATIGLKTKKIVSVRNDPNREYGNKFYQKLSAQILFLLADGCVFQTNEAKSYFSKHTQRKSIVIYNPIGEEFYLIQRNTNSRNIITIGRLESQKNHCLLISAFSNIAEEFPKENLLIYGEGSLKGKLQDMIKNLDLEQRVFLKGDTKQVPKVLENAKLFVLSSDFEGMPNALMEAMAVGVPSISTDCPCGGPKEIIEDGKDGILVPCGSVEQLEIAIRKMLLQEEKRKKIGIKAKAKAQKFRAEIIYQKWYQYFISIL